MPATTSPRLAELFGLEGLIVRDDLQQDKQAALSAVARLFSDYGVPYAITGGIAVQLYVRPGEVRFTADVAVVSVRDRFRVIKLAEPWSKYGFEFVFDRRRYVKIRHVASNVDVDINLDTRFTRLLDSPVHETVAEHVIPFVAPLGIAFAKLRTQRQDWPRDPAKRLQDRADLIRLFRNRPGLSEQLRSDSDLTEEMRTILAEIETEVSRSSKRTDPL